MNGTTIVIIVVALAAGYLFGMLDSRFTQRLRKKPEKPAPLPAPEAPKEQNLPGERTILKVTVDPELKYHVELEGSRLDNPAALAPEQRQRMVNVVVQMRPWIDGKSAPASVAAPAPATIQQPAPVQPGPAPVAAPRPVSEMPPAPRPIPVPPATKAASEPTPPKIDPMRGLRSMLKNEVKSPDAMKGPSIVGMIDNVLQTKIPGTPFAGKGIRLEEGSLGEVIVYVGASRYSGIDAVPDPEIQALIRSAIAEWEKH